MPSGKFFDLHAFPSWTQYSLASKSLLAALDIDDPEETMFLQLSVAELSIISFGLLVLARIFPEFVKVASNLSLKVSDCSNAQGFLRIDGLDSE